MKSLGHRKNSQYCNDVVLMDRGVLSPRQAEAVLCTAEGLTSEDTAMVMGISTRTANAHVEDAMSKLGALNRPHLIALAFCKGIVRTAQEGKASVLLLVANLFLASLFSIFAPFASSGVVDGEGDRDRVKPSPRKGGARRSARRGRNTMTRREGYSLDDLASVLGDRDLLAEMLEGEVMAV